ncbi:MAG TPA: ABC transporter permease [Bacillota bacterium]
MRFSENFLMAFRNLKSNKIRSLLTMLGIIIGVGAVIVMMALGEGSKKKITDSITAMGSNLLMVSPGRGSRRGGSFGGGQEFDNKILKVIQNSSPYIEAIAPQAQSTKTVQYGGNSLDTNVIGCTVNYPAIRNYKIARGRFFSRHEEESKKRVAVIGSYVAEELFEGSDPLNTEIKIGKVRLKVIGVLAEKGQGGFGNNDDLILVPLTMAQRRIFGSNRLNMVSVKIKSEKEIDLAYEQLYTALLEKFKNKEDKFSLRNQAEILSTVEETSQTFTLLLVGIAAVSLVVGGIGIMNIMLVSVTERIREIGIRKAIGAQKEEILLLFLIEAVLLSLTGGVIGVLAGCAVAQILARLGWSIVITFKPVLLSFAFSIAIGLFFGVFPAYKAAGMDPVEALRYE